MTDLCKDVCCMHQKQSKQLAPALWLTRAAYKCGPLLLKQCPAPRSERLLWVYNFLHCVQSVQRPSCDCDQLFHHLFLVTNDYAQIFCVSTDQTNPAIPARPCEICKTSFINVKFPAGLVRVRVSYKIPNSLNPKAQLAQDLSR